MKRNSRMEGGAGGHGSGTSGTGLRKNWRQPYIQGQVGMSPIIAEVEGAIPMERSWMMEGGAGGSYNGSPGTGLRKKLRQQTIAVQEKQKKKKNSIVSGLKQRKISHNEAVSVMIDEGSGDSSEMETQSCKRLLNCKVSSKEMKKIREAGKDEETEYGRNEKMTDRYRGKIDSSAFKMKHSEKASKTKEGRAPFKEDLNILRSHKLANQAVEISRKGKKVKGDGTTKEEKNITDNFTRKKSTCVDRGETSLQATARKGDEPGGVAEEGEESVAAALKEGKNKEEILALPFMRRWKERITVMSPEDLEELVVQKLCEALTMESKVAQRQQRLLALQKGLENLKKGANSLALQVRHVCSNVITLKPQEHDIIKQTRSVGIQVGLPLCYVLAGGEPKTFGSFSPLSSTSTSELSKLEVIYVVGDDDQF